MRVTLVFRSPEEWPRLARALSHILRALYELDCDYLRETPDAPHPYKAGLVYRLESLYPEPVEDWTDIPESLAAGRVDCEDIAAYLAAWRTVREGRPALPVPIRQPGKINGYNVVHIVVRYANGQTEDPSRVLREQEGAQTWQ